MKKNCIFCRIINREAPANFVYEDGLVTAFLDINPLSEGHTLVVPRKHFENIFDVDEDVLERIISVSKKISHRMMEVLDVTGVNLVNNSDVPAEQSVFHFHLHIIPRREEDNLGFVGSWWQSRARKPKCSECVLSRLCPSSGKFD